MGPRRATNVASLNYAGAFFKLDNDVNVGNQSE